MVSGISAVGGYSGSRPYAPVNPASSADRSPSVSVRKPSELGSPVQPVGAVRPVDPGVSGNLNVDLTPRTDPTAAELSAKLRMSPDRSQSRTPAEEPKAEGAERQDAAAAEEEAAARREAYLEALEEEEAAREERIAALKEQLSAEEEEPASEQEEEEQEESGSLRLDHTSALLRNMEMTNLLHDQLSARAKGEDTTGFSQAIEMLFDNGQSRVRFSTEQTEEADARRRYREHVNPAASTFGAVA